MEERITTAGIAIKDGKVLIAHRIPGGSLSGKWEFPGGKREAGESLEECLHRELLEELHLDVQVGDFFMESRYEYPDFSISLNAFWCLAKTNKIDYMDSHEQIRWIDPLTIEEYDFAPADKPILEGLVAHFKEIKK